MILNLNVGILGHVDSGKTSLAKCLSDTASTACFDKNPQSQERGITLDLGFSAYQCDLPKHLSEHSKCSQLQFTFIDCPGHAKLIRTVIGGSQIMDMFVLVVDITKGIQTQTAECLVIGGLTCDRMIVALNKTDLLDVDKRDKMIEKMTKKISQVLADTPFKDSPIIPVSAQSNFNITELMNACLQSAYVPLRNPTLPFLFAVDHCFSIRGQGTICTGTVLQGRIKIGDDVEIPSIQQIKKVKSIQMFRQKMNDAQQGDRIGIAITQFDSKLLERGLIAAPRFVNYSTAAVIKLNKIKYFKGAIGSKSKFHISIGHSTVMASVLLFQGGPPSDNFDCHRQYEYLPVLDDPCEDDGKTEATFALLEFQKPTIVVADFLIVASKLDMDLQSTNCRLAFWGRLNAPSDAFATADSFASSLNIFKEKTKEGRIQRVVNSQEIVVDQMFKRNSNRQIFVGLRVCLSSGHCGVIDSTFGTTTKVKVRLNDHLAAETIQQWKDEKVDVKVMLKFKKFLFRTETKIFQ
ncbi:hypothetical protein HA402_003862 [Bradysia odoriphaga]|nr:hypothetical protein HA402_003862 [Bradysia odoriphaga]